VRHFRFDRLIMGAKVAPWIFSLLTATILSILRARGHAEVSLVWVDDFLLFAPTATQAEAALAELKSILVALNILHAEDKTSVRAATRDVLLGLLCDLQALTLALPAAKLVRLLARARALSILGASGATFPTMILASVAGGVSNLARVDNCVASGARALASYFHGQGGRYGWARFKASLHTLSPAEAEALRWLHEWAATGRMQPVTFLPAAGSLPILDFTSDASGTNAMGIVTQVTRLRVNLPDCGSLGIPSLEGLGWPVFLQEYGFLAPGFLFRQGCDSMGICFRQAKGSAREPIDNDIVHLCTVASRHAGQRSMILFNSRYVNGISDRLSAESVQALVARGYLLPGEAQEITLSGLPPDFLAPLKSRAPGSLPWRSPTQWAQVTKRH